MYSKIYSYILNNKFYHSTVDLNTFIVVIFIGKIHEIILYPPKNKKKIIKKWGKITKLLLIKIGISLKFSKKNLFSRMKI